MPWHRWLGILPIRLSDRDYLARVARDLACRMLICASDLSGGQVRGFPDISQTRQLKRSRRVLDELPGVTSNIADPRLRDLMAQLAGKLSALVELDAKAAGYMARYMGRDPLDARALARYLRSPKFRADYPSGAVWSREPEYLPLRRKSMSTLDSAWLIDRGIAAQVRELVEESGGVFVDAASRYPSIPRPADQLRGSIEAMRREIRTASAALSESAGKLAGLGMADLPPRSKKDSASK